jgi:hypothetical protein
MVSLDRLKEASDRIVARKDTVLGKGEQATRQAMILPMIEALGYDIWNPAEVCPEFEADTAVKKAGQKEKVDYAIVLDGTARIFIEVKPLGEPLAPHAGQLARYFNSTPSVVLSVITDGIEFLFFTDTGEPNIQDSEPFFTARLDSADPGFDIFARFTKPHFQPANIRDLATDLKYTAKVEKFLRDELDLRDREPSEALVKWILGEPTVWGGTRTVSVVSRFRPIVKQSLVRLLRDIVRRSMGAIDHSVGASPTADNTPPVNPSPSPSDSGNAVQDVTIVTTARELACFDNVKTIFDAIPTEQRRLWDQTLKREVEAQLGHKDTATYFGIYLNKPSWWVIRCFVEQRRPHITLDITPEEVASMIPEEFEVLQGNSFGATRIAIREPSDILKLRAVVEFVLRKHLS